MLKHLFELIRNGEVLLFVGAGCSATAGFPNGREFAQKLYDNLSDNEKVGLSNNLPLPEMSEEYVKRRNRNSLLQMVLNTFSSPATNMDFHNKLGTIPYFKTIVTTNYDRLIESGYGYNECQVVHNDTDCSYLDAKKVHVFKIHGDIDDKEHIIITKGDYNKKTFGNDVDFPQFWGVVKAEMIQKNILFIGYGIGDGNIEEILANIQKCVGEHQREMFLLAPKWSQYDQINLIQKGIKYIDTDCNSFIDQLINNIKENVISDISNGNIETNKLVLKKYNISPVIQVKGTQNIIKTFEPLEGNKLETCIKFTVDNDIAQKLLKPVMTYDPQPIVVPKSQMSGFISKVNDLTIINHNNLKQISVKPEPKFKKDVDIILDNNVSHTVPIKVFNSPEGPSIIFDLSILEGCLHSFKNQDFKFTPTLKNKCPNIYKAIHDIKLLEQIVSGIDFEIIISNHPIQVKGKKVEDLLAYFKTIKSYYEKILDIQRFYKISFQNFDNFSEENWKKVILVHSYVKNYGFIKHDIEHLIMDIQNEDNKEELSNLPNNKPCSVISKVSKRQKINLFNKELSLECLYKVFPTCYPKYQTNEDGNTILILRLNNSEYLEYYYQDIDKMKYDNYILYEESILSNVSNTSLQNYIDILFPKDL